MKKTVILLVGGDDYSALQFEESNKTVDCAIEMVRRGVECLDRDFYANLTLKEFDGHLSQEFINFVRNEVQDYDHSKHKNFYVKYEN